MTKSEILAILKSDLEIAQGTTSKDDLLNNLIEVSLGAIAREGITLSDPYTVEEGMLVEMYAAFLYRKRREIAKNTKYETIGAMPHSLRYMLNNMLLQQKARLIDG